MSPQRPEIIVYGYKQVPNPQKIFQFLALFAIPYKYVELPVIMPRPQLTEIGVTYRRTPLLSIGSDMYVDTALIIAKLADIAQHSDTGLKDNTNHVEYDALGQLGFQLAVGLMPPTTPMLLDPAFLADRSDMMGQPFVPALMAKARPQTLSKMLSLVQLVQRNLLADGGRRFFLGGDAPSTADMYLYWSLNWGLRYVPGARPEVSPSSHPRIFAWLEDVERFIAPRTRETQIAAEEAYAVLRVPPTHEYAKFVPHVADNPEGLAAGQKVKVTPTDIGKSGPQFGELISLNYEQVCLRNEKGLVMHFPRFGYDVVSAGG